MKAAVLEQFGSAPVYTDFPDHTPSDGELLMRVKAASVKNLDKLRTQFAFIVP